MPCTRQRIAQLVGQSRRRAAPASASAPTGGSSGSSAEAGRTCRLIDRARSWTSSWVVARARARGNRPRRSGRPGARSRRIRPLIRCAIQVVTAAISGQGPCPEDQRHLGRLPPGLAPARLRDRGPARPSEIARCARPIGPREWAWPPIDSLGASLSEAGTGPGFEAAIDSSAGAPVSKPGSLAAIGLPSDVIGDELGPGEALHPGQDRVGQGEVRPVQDVDDAVQAGRRSAAPSAVPPAPPRRS